MLVVGRRLSYSRTDINEQAAVFMAEAGVNDELNFISKNITATSASARSTQPGTRAGQPYAGRYGTVPNAEGAFWVYTSADLAGTTPWDGASRVLYVQSVAKVKDVVKRVRINGVLPGTPGGTTPPVPPTPFVSPFGTYALFGVDNKNGNSHCIQVPGSAEITVDGIVGTNGKVQRGGDGVTYTAAHNFDTGSYSGKQGWTAAPVYYKGDALQWLSVTEVVRRTFNLGSSVDPWTYLASNNDNDRIRVYASTNPSLTPLGTALAGTTKTQTILANTSQSGTRVLKIPSAGSSLSLGSWTGLRLINNKRTLIFPPGDYLLSDLDLSNNGGTELILDYGGLTVGGNPTRKPIRFWMNGGSGGDRYGLPASMTVPGGSGVASTGDATGFRLFYNNSSTLDIDTPDKNVGLTLYGAIYAVSDDGSTQIDFKVAQQSPGTTLYGALIADKIRFWGTAHIIFPPTLGQAIANPNDPAFGVQYAVGYVSY